jgi:hypothetical protein
LGHNQRINKQAAQQNKRNPLHSVRLLSPKQVSFRNHPLYSHYPPHQNAFAYSPTKWQILKILDDKDNIIKGLSE